MLNMDRVYLYHQLHLGLDAGRVVRTGLDGHSDPQIYDKIEGIWIPFLKWHSEYNNPLDDILGGEYSIIPETEAAKLNSDFVATAEAFARCKFEGIVDKAGAPYFGHLSRVAAAQHGREIPTAIAFLHDVLEDTDTSVQELLELFPRAVVEGVQVLTRGTQEPYIDYIRRIRDHLGWDVSSVKQADIKDNMDLSRLHIPKQIQAGQERIESEG